MNYKDLLSLATQIAYYMKGAWRVDLRPVDEDRHYLGVCLLCEGNHAIRIQDAKHLRKKGKLYIRGECPDFGLNYQEQRNAGLPRYHKGIYVPQNRHSKDIAGDIKRRLIPDYMELLGEAFEISTTYKRNMEDLDYIEQGFKSIARYLRPYSDNRYSQQRQQHTFTIPSSRYQSADLELSHYKGQRCDLQLPDISVETAMRIIALLKEEKT